jgi:hypothetical protein
MIATNKAGSFNALRKIPGGKILDDFICAKIAGIINQELKHKGHKTVLSSSYVLNATNDLVEKQSYEELYNKYFSRVDGGALTAMINSFLETIQDKTEQEQLGLLKLYIFVFFTDSWCQLVEFVKEANEPNLFFIGSMKRAEYAILKNTLEVKFSGIEIYKSTSTLYSAFQNLLGLIGENIKKRRELDVSKILNNFSNNPSFNVQFQRSEKVVVIGVLEERRLGRISELHRELTSLGYKVILFSCLQKSEFKKGLLKYPNLQDSVFYDSFLLNKNDVQSILNNKKTEIDKIFNRFQNSDVINNECTYDGVCLFKYTWCSLHTIIKHRYLESAIDQEAIQRYLSKTDICCFIGLDNSVATSVWMNECKKRKIPSVFHFYNAAQSPIVYRTLLESVNPTAWLLGGVSQLNKFEEIQSEKNNRFYITGDIFTDTVVNCDKESIRKNIREIAGLSEEDTVVVLVSSYVVSEFSSESKKMLFQSVIRASISLGYKVIIKAHPNEGKGLLKKELEEWGLDAFIFHRENIRDVFISADLVCMYFSEAAQQAMLVEVPIISLVPSGIVDSFDKHWSYYSSGAVEFVPLGEDPSNAISRVISDSSYRAELLKRAKDYSEKLLGKCDGKNAKRFAGIVDSIIKESLIN